MNQEASFKVQAIHAKKMNLGEGETLNEEDIKELDVQRLYCEEYANEIKESCSQDLFLRCGADHC